MSKRHPLQAFFLAILLIFSCAAAETSSVTEEEAFRSRSATYNGIRSFCGKTYVYYAQNSPEWDKVGLGKGNTVGGAMCATTALSNVIVNSVPYSDLSLIETITKTPVRFDTHNVAPGFGCVVRCKFVIRQDCDYFRFFPLCLGNYASGNNNIGCTEPRNTSHYRSVLKAYGLDYNTTKDADLCIECIEEGAFVIACTGGKASPIAPKSGHFFVLAAVKHGYVYCIDSYCRETYPYDRKHLIEIVEPGIIRVPVDEIRYLCLSGTMFIIWPNATETYTQDEYDRIILETQQKSTPAADSERQGKGLQPYI